MRPNATGISTSVPGGRQMKNGGLYFNPAAFSPTPSSQFGNAARYLSDVRVPGTLNWDMLASKRILLRESVTLDFRGEFFNTFNNVQFVGTGHEHQFVELRTDLLESGQHPAPDSGQHAPELLGG